jgi:hypothetical protein
MCNQWFSVAAEVFKSTSLTLHKQQQSRLALQIQKAWFGCAILRIGWSEGTFIYRGVRPGEEYLFEGHDISHCFHAASLNGRMSIDACA